MENHSLLDCWTMFRRERNNISVDRMLCDSELRSQFLASVAGIDSTVTESQVLWQLMGLRKNKKLIEKVQESLRQ